MHSIFVYYPQVVFCCCIVLNIVVKAMVNIDHNDITLDLAKKESASHFHGMQELYDEMRKRPLKIRAVPVDEIIDDKTSSDTVTKVMTCHFIRHGQGFHNLMADLFHGAGKQWTQFEKSDDNPYVMPEILDAPLTEKGRQQAAALQQTIKICEQPQIILLSPNCRALQTGVIAFEYIVKNDEIPFFAHEMLREETGVHLCDKRRSVSRQRQEFPMVDFSLIEDDEDNIFLEDRRETKMEVGERIYKFFEFLYSREETAIGITSHSGWLMTAFNGICEVDHSHLKKWFQTGEMRSVKLIFEVKK